MARPPLELDMLRMLRRSAEPLSGRRLADIAGVAPNTANRALKSLREGGLVRSEKKGSAMLWTTTADVAGLPDLEGAAQERIALVVTAVDLEHTEVLNRLVNAVRVRVGDIWMVRGEVPGNSIDWTVYAARAGMGNATSAALVGLAANDLKANLIAFVGTAAGLKPADQRHLDVVVASQIHNPYSGKQVSTESGSQLLGRGKAYTVPAPLISLVNACIADSKWTPSKRNENYDIKHPHAFVSPIVSVEAVQADPNGPVLQEIRSRFQDAAALDMESFGLAAGSDIHDLPVLVMRGVSDFIGDKSEPGNDSQQPLAARNAAGLFRSVLAYAHPDDFKRGRQVPSSPDPSDHVGAPTVELPGAAQIWMERLGRRSSTRAKAARDALARMREDGVSAATWLSQALHRPPAWLREDDTGDGWALVASLASLSGSKVAWRAFERAADAARLTGEMDASSFLRLVARLERIGAEDDLGGGDHAEEPDPTALDDFDDEVVARLGPVIDVYRAVLEKDLAKTKDRAEIALASLGLCDQSGVLGVPAEAPRILDFDAELRDLVAATVLRQLATTMLAPGAADELGVQSGLAARQLRGNPVTRDLADDGMRLARWAVDLRPNSEGTLLTLAQTTLAVLVSLTARTTADVDDEISRRARHVETDAMLVRESLRDWGGSSGGALAVAARARSVQGDFVGALRMLLPAPDGIASQQESRHPEVVRIGAYIARVVGNDELALELAAKNTDKVEGALMRAAVLADRPQMAAEAKEALFAALAEAKGDHHGLFQVLMALSRRFNSLSDTEQGAVVLHIDRLEMVDSELAEVIRARALISKGDTEGALRHVRGLERNELALEAYADALIAGNRADEAVRLVFKEGMSRSDIPLVVHALELAMDSGLSDLAREIALTMLGRDDCKPLRLKALRALQQTARSEAKPNWSEVATRTNQIIEELRSNNLPVPEVEHWRLAEALLFQEKFEKALTVLLDVPGLSFNERERAQLFITVIWHVIDRQRGRANGPDIVNLGDTKLYAMFMRAAAHWAHDEQIAAAAMSVVLTAPDSSFTESQVADFRDYAENYFARHGEATSIKRVAFAEDNHEPLFELLRAGEGRQRALGELAREVRTGRYPLAVLCEAAGRTTTESLIRRDLGYVIAVGDDATLGEQQARKAIGCRVVVDVTALVVGPWTGETFRKLAANFDSVCIPAQLREDVVRARSMLAMKSTATLSWDSRFQRPVVSEISDEESQAYVDAVEQVWADAQRLQVASVSEVGRRDRWLSAITLAQTMGVPLWADDVAIRRFARAVGVPAFGSIDLISALDGNARLAAAITAFRDNRVVDIHIDQSWYSLAARAKWSTESPLAIAISRPQPWRDLSKAFASFQSLIRMRPKDMDHRTTAAWIQLAANGLALADMSPTRYRAVSGLLAWAIMNADPFFTSGLEGAAMGDDAKVPEEGGQLTELVVAAADTLRDQHYPLADALGSLVDILCGVLIDSFEPGTASRIVGALVKRLSRETGSRVFAAYIQSEGR